MSSLKLSRCVSPCTVPALVPNSLVVFLLSYTEITFLKKIIFVLAAWFIGVHPSARGTAATKSFLKRTPVLRPIVSLRQKNFSPLFHCFMTHVNPLTHRTEPIHTENITGWGERVTYCTFSFCRCFTCLATDFPCKWSQFLTLDLHFSFLFFMTYACVYEDTAHHVGGWVGGKREGLKIAGTKHQVPSTSWD